MGHKREMTAVGVGALTERSAGLCFSLWFLYLRRGARLACRTMSNRRRVLAVERNTENKENEYENTDGANVA
jgi:hypothetical protein